GSSISLGGNWTNGGTFTFTGQNTNVIFAGTAQALTGATAFRRLTVNTGSTVTLHNSVSVDFSLNVSGLVDPGDSPTYTISGGGKINLNGTGTLLVKAGTFAGNYALSGSQSIASTTTIDYTSSTLNQTVSNAPSYGNLRISGGLTKTLAGNIPSVKGD